MGKPKGFDVSKEPHWLYKDFNVLYRCAQQLVDAYTDEGRPYPPLRALEAQLERLKKLGISPDATAHGIAAHDWSRLVDDALAGDRGRNFIGRREALLAEMAA